METIKHGAFEYTPADNEAIERFMENFTSEKELEQFLDATEDDLESMGFAMNPEHNAGLMVKDTGWVDQLQDRYAQAKVEKVKLTKATLKALIDEEKYIKFGESLLDPSLVLKAMKVLEAFEDGGETTGVRAMATTDMPVWFINEEGLGVIIAPCVGLSSECEVGFSQRDLEKSELEDIRQWRIAQENPHLVRIYLHDGNKVNVRWDWIEGIARDIMGYWLVPRDGSDAWHITEKTKDEIMENLPHLEIDDRRGKVPVDHERLTYEVEKAWRKRDPTFDDVDGYGKCLQELVELYEYYGGPGCTIDFYIEHFGEEVPNLLTKHRSTNTPEEWGRSLIKLLLRANIVGVALSTEDNGTKGTLTLSFTDLEASIPDVVVTQAQYKASHLLEYLADVDFTTYDHRGTNPRIVWEMKTQITDFEVENVRA